MAAIVSAPSPLTFPLEARSFHRQSGEVLACEHVGTSQFLAITHRKHFSDGYHPLSGPCTGRNRVLHRVFSDSGSNSVDGSDELEESRDVVSEILEGFGVSKEKSFRIASKCPAYIKTLVGNVRELDEARLWETWRREERDFGKLSFKKKVWYIAKGKGDDGLIPFLESIGLTASSSTYVARYLSGKVGLIELVEKVIEFCFS